MSQTAPSSFPYGPATPAIRRFLVRLAALGASERQIAIASHAAAHGTRAWQIAETALGEIIERSGRGQAQEALAGPLLQLVRRPNAQAPIPESSEEALDTLEPMAEPALAALLALVVQDLLEPRDFATLYAPMANVIPLDALTS